MTVSVTALAWLALGLAVTAFAGLIAYATVVLVLHKHRINRSPHPPLSVCHCTPEKPIGQETA